MKTLNRLAAVLAIVGALCPPSLAGNCATVLHNGQVQVLDVRGNRVVVTQFVQPLGLPVAVAAVPGAHYQWASPQAMSAEDAALIKEFREWKAARVQAAAVPATAVQTSCIKCHSGSAPKAGVDLSGELSDELRLRASRAVLSGKMPPKSKLDGPAAAKLLGELLGENKPKETK